LCQRHHLLNWQGSEYLACAPGSVYTHTKVRSSADTCATWDPCCSISETGRPCLHHLSAHHRPGMGAQRARHRSIPPATGWHKWCRLPGLRQHLVGRTEPPSVFHLLAAGRLLNSRTKPPSEHQSLTSGGLPNSQLLGLTLRGPDAPRRRQHRRRRVVHTHRRPKPRRLSFLQHRSSSRDRVVPLAWPR
jgi:hypothetical protein